MDDVALLDAPERDRAEIEQYIESHGGAIVLRVGDKIGSDAKAAMLAYRKTNGELPPHDFVWIGESTLGRDASAADVDGAGSETRSGRHESVGERQGRQPAPSWFRRLFGRRVASQPEREWLPDDDPIARVVNEAWEKGASAWTESEPLPELNYPVPEETADERLERLRLVTATGQPEPSKSLLDWMREVEDQLAALRVAALQNAIGGAA